MMSCVLHNLIENYNVLRGPTTTIHTFLRNHPNLYKAALLVNHVVRALFTAAFCSLLPFPALVNIALCLTTSLFYRLTVEVNCAYKFALPAFAGSFGLIVGQTALTHLISGLAFTSLTATATTLGALLPLAAYTAYIVLTVNYDVEHQLAR